MLPRHLLDAVTTPDGRRLELSRRGDDFLIQIDRHDLMSSRSHGSEEALARLALDACAPRGATRWLVGGLGMGFTLGACLEALGDHGEAGSVVVAEVFEAVVRWNLEYLGDLAARRLDDPRTRVVVGDVYDQLDPDGTTFDVILLDVDNGPEALTLDSNNRLYRGRGLHRLREKLSAGGVLAVWSAFPDERFRRRLVAAGFTVECHKVRARHGKGDRHTILLAKPRSAGSRPRRGRKRRARR